MSCETLASATIDAIKAQLSKGLTPTEVAQRLNVSLQAVNYCKLQLLEQTSQSNLPTFADIARLKETTNMKPSSLVEKRLKLIARRLLIAGFFPRQVKFFTNLSIHKCTRMLTGLKQELLMFKPLSPFPDSPAARVIATVFLSHFIPISIRKGMKKVDLDCFIHAWRLTFDQVHDLKNDFLDGQKPELLLPGTLFDLAHGYYESGDQTTPAAEVQDKKSRKFLLFECPHCNTSFPVFLAKADEKDSQDCPFCTFLDRTVELDFTDRILKKPRQSVRRRLKKLTAAKPA